MKHGLSLNGYTSLNEDVKYRRRLNHHMHVDYQSERYYQTRLINEKTYEEKMRIFRELKGIRKEYQQYPDY